MGISEHSRVGSLECMYIDLLVIVNNSRKISHRLLSYSLLEPIEVLHPTPLCHIAYVTLLFAVGSLGIVKLEKKRRSTRVSSNSSARGFTSSKSCSSGFGE